MLVTKAECRVESLRPPHCRLPPTPFIFNLFNILSASLCTKRALSNELLGLLGVFLCAPWSASAGKLVHHALCVCLLSFRCTALSLLLGTEILWLFYRITYILHFMPLSCVNQILSHHEFLEHIFKPSSCTPREAVSVLRHKIGRFFAKTALYKGLVACINIQRAAFKDKQKPQEQTVNQSNNIFKKYFTFSSCF